MSGAKIAIVLVRDLAGASGREGIIRQMLAALQVQPERCFRLRSLLELRSPRHAAAAALAWLQSLARGRKLPLQCLLYGSPLECERLARQIKAGGFTHVYLDTVRCQMLLRALRRHLPHAHIVADFDDLMSRRMESLVRLGQPFLTGHAAGSFPAWLRQLVEGPLSRIITRFEATTLRHAETEVAASADAVVLISPLEREILAARIPARAPCLHAVLPPVKLRTPAPQVGPLRFVFIGSDQLLQNRLSIDRLLALWRQCRPGADLHLYGRQTRAPVAVPGVVWHGFAANLAEVYRRGSILIYPGVLPGGIKTKVAEAWSFGCPVLGNEVTFEGFGLSHYPLALPECAWGDLLAAPERYRALWLRAAAIGHEYAGRHLAPELFDDAWRRAMALKETPVTQYGVKHVAGVPDETISYARNNTMYDAVSDAAGPGWPIG